MRPIIFDKLANGLPGTSPLDDLSGRTEYLEFTHAALWGPFTARVRWAGSLRDAFHVADQWLGNPIHIYDPSGTLQWSGLIWTVRFGAGRRRQRSRSLEGYANRARVHYRKMDFSTSPPIDLGLATPIVADDAAEQAIYGIIEHQRSPGGMTATTATNLSTRTLAERKRLLWLPESGVLGYSASERVTLGTSAGDKPGQIELECMGWWRTLGYQAYTATTSGTAELATVVQNILTASAPFLLASYDQIATTGISVQRQFDKYELPTEIIKRLLQTANGYTFGIDVDRVPYLRANQLLATTPTYYERLDGTIEGAGGQEIPLWDVRPDNVLRQLDFVPTSANLSAAIDSIESIYLAETTWSTPNQLTYKAAVAGVLGEVSAL